MDASIGSALRDAREHHGLSIDTVAFELDVEPHHLRALEEDRLEQELGAPLAATQAKLYAVFLGLDAKSLLAGLPARARSTASPASALSSHHAAGAGTADPGQPAGSTLVKERGDDGGPDDEDDTAELLVADEAEEDGTVARWTRRARRLRPVGPRPQADAEPDAAPEADAAFAPDADAAGASDAGAADDADSDARWQPGPVEAGATRVDPAEAGTAPGELDETDAVGSVTPVGLVDPVERDGLGEPVDSGESGATRVDPVDLAAGPVAVSPAAGAPADGAGVDAVHPDDALADDLPADDDAFADDAYRRRRALAVVGGMLLAAVLISFTLTTLTGQRDEVELTDGGTAVEPAAPVQEPAQDAVVVPDADADAEEAADDPAPGEGTTSEEADDAPVEAAAGPPADAADTRVQVLDGVGDRVAYQDAIAYLEELGYQVLRSGGSGREYAQTTLFFTSTGADQAADLAAYDPLRFTVVRPNDRGLSEQLELHLVVGADWPTGEEAVLTDS